ncbi:MAG: Flp/Fap pilin component [Hyphomicrobiales bacterium]|nr:Flp/Fap pilin component [Hyphomicrobiales bacterium]
MAYIGRGAARNNLPTQRAQARAVKRFFTLFIHSLVIGEDMNKLLLSFMKDKRGATALEYCMIAALISIVVIVGATRIGTGVKSKFISVSTNLT